MSVFFAERALKPGGVFLAKVLAGGAEPELQKSLKIKFEKVSSYWINRRKKVGSMKKQF